MLSEKAPALDGMLHVEDVGIGTWRVANAASDGGPKAPVKPWPVRVSITLQGVIAINVIGPGGAKMLTACASDEALGWAMRCCSTSRGVGAQYSGAAQFLRGGLRGCCA